MKNQHFRTVKGRDETARERASRHGMQCFRPAQVEVEWQVSNGSDKTRSS